MMQVLNSDWPMLKKRNDSHFSYQALIYLYSSLPHLLKLKHPHGLEFCPNVNYDRKGVSLIGENAPELVWHGSSFSHSLVTQYTKET